LEPNAFKSKMVGVAELQNTGGRTQRQSFVVLENDELRVGPWEDRVHPALAEGKPVKSAGEFWVRDGEIIAINNDSGSYRPYGLAARDAAEGALAQFFRNAWGKWRPTN
jgi:hypothetical protein